MRLGIMGGSFNPVHLGHLFLADKAFTALNLDRIVLIPAYRSPFKLDHENILVNANDRLEMLAAAVAGDARFTIDECEIRREGISYTIDTLEDIVQRYMPTGKPVIIIGDDLAKDFPKWRSSEKILEMADIAIGRRLNVAVEEYPFPHTILDNEIMDISSGAVRELISEGQDRLPWRSLVPAGVRAIIEGRELYGFGSRTAKRRFDYANDCTKTNILRIEEAVRASVSTERFLHSRNTAVLAHDLCLRFGLDPNAGYLAGIAHDIAKELSSKQMIKLAKTGKIKTTDIEKKKPSLLHGRAGAVLLKERFCINNEDVLEAVQAHTYGKHNMGDLAKVIYIADKAEVSRNIDPELRRMCLLPNKEDTLDSILFAVLNKTVHKLQARQLVLSEDTLRLLDRMKENCQ